MNKRKHSMNYELFGTDPHLLHRCDSPETSIEAAHAVDSTALEKLVFSDILEAGRKGCISDQIRAKHPNLPYSSITARYAALERKKFIFYAGDKRKGQSGRSQRVIRAARFRENYVL